MTVKWLEFYAAFRLLAGANYNGNENCFWRSAENITYEVHPDIADGFVDLCRAHGLIIKGELVTFKALRSTWFTGTIPNECFEGMPQHIGYLP